MPIPPRLRDVLAEGRRTLRIVENQQPILDGLTSGQRIHDHAYRVIALVGLEVLQSKPSAQAYEGGCDGIFLLRADPPDKIVLVPIAMRILSCKFGLADTTESVHRLYRMADQSRGTRLSGQERVQGCKLLLPSDEVRVPERDLSAPYGMTSP